MKPKNAHQWPFFRFSAAFFAAALLLSLYNLWENNRAGKASSDMLNALLPQIPEEHFVSAQPPLVEEDPEEVVYPDYIAAPEMEPLVAEANDVPLVGILRIPDLARELPVIAEWNNTNLKKAPCRYEGSPYIGNFVICAHNYDQHFGQIESLKQNAVVTFTDIEGREFRYRVRKIEILDGNDSEGMVDSPYDLTLFTCTLDGRSRITVRCEKDL